MIFYAFSGMYSPIFSLPQRLSNCFFSHVTLTIHCYLHTLLSTRTCTELFKLKTYCWPNRETAEHSLTHMLSTHSSIVKYNVFRPNQHGHSSIQSHYTHCKSTTDVTCIRQADIQTSYHLPKKVLRRGKCEVVKLHVTCDGVTK